MARVTYTGRAGRIRIAGGAVLERNVPTEVPTELAKRLAPSEFDVVMPVKRQAAPRQSTTTKKAGGSRARAKKES